MLLDLQNFIDQVRKQNVSAEREAVLQPLIEYIQQKVNENVPVHLNFICTHNSRRSQLAQIWAQTAAYYYDVAVSCYSGGVEVTAFNERAVDSIKRAGLKVESEGGDNPLYKVHFSEKAKAIRAFSKVFDDQENQAKQFAAIMTCDHADENCPFIPGTEQRIAVRYEDPKAFDDSPLEAKKYDERSLQIATEMFYVFSKISD